MKKIKEEKKETKAEADVGDILIKSLQAINEKDKKANAELQRLIDAFLGNHNNCPFCQVQNINEDKYFKGSFGDIYSSGLAWIRNGLVHQKCGCSQCKTEWIEMYGPIACKNPLHHPTVLYLDLTGDGITLKWGCKECKIEEGHRNYQVCDVVFLNLK